MGRNRASSIAIGFAMAAAATVVAALPASAVADRDCSDFASQRAAQIFFLKHGGPDSDPHGLDAEGDGIACESNPAPYYYGTSLPGGGGSPQPAPPQVTVIKSSVKLSIAPNRAIEGESFDMTVTVRPKVSRPVLVQRWANGRWRAFGKGVTSRKGMTAGAFRAPANTVRYRALVRPVKVGNKKFTSATSAARSLRVQKQRVVLRFDDYTLEEGETARASVRATPARPDRAIAIQVRQPGGWSTVRVLRENRDGAARFSLPAAQVGNYSYRAVVQRHRGAAARASRLREVTVRDVTPPSVPAMLTASAGDGAVTLTWSAVEEDDLSHYLVWVRQDGVSTWSLAASTTETTADIGSLANDVLYWFTVSSVDFQGNESAPAPEVSATPIAPEPTTP